MSFCSYKMGDVLLMMDLYEEDDDEDVELMKLCFEDELVGLISHNKYKQCLTSFTI